MVDTFITNTNASGWAETALSNKHINILEMYAVMAAADTWAHMRTNSTIVFIADSTIVQAALTSGKSKSKVIMDLLRRLFWLSVQTLQWNFIYKAVHVSVTTNNSCDALSRLNIQSSNIRIQNVDNSSLLCCSHIFISPLQT